MRTFWIGRGPGDFLHDGNESIDCLGKILGSTASPDHRCQTMVKEEKKKSQEKKCQGGEDEEQGSGTEVTHQATSVARVEDPAKGFGEVV